MQIGPDLDISSSAFKRELHAFALGIDRLTKIAGGIDLLLPVSVLA
jgi:hypothetical protein